MRRNWFAFLMVLGCLMAPLAFAQTNEVAHGATVTEAGGGSIDLKTLAAVGAGLVVIGTGLGIGRLAAAALEGIARQPEAAKPLQTNMLIAAALIEGVALLCAIICILGIL